MFIFFLHWHLNRFSAGFNQLTWAAYLPLFALIVSSQILLRFNVEKFFILSTNGWDQYGRSVFSDFRLLQSVGRVLRRESWRSLLDAGQTLTDVCLYARLDREGEKRPVYKKPADLNQTDLCSGVLQSRRWLCAQLADVHIYFPVPLFYARALQVCRGRLLWCD